MRLNFGCGKKVLPGYFNVDAVHNKEAPRKPDLIHAVEFDSRGRLVNPLPLDNESCEEVCSFHVLEHVFAWEAPYLVGEWLRLLSTGGRLILELPNIDLAAKNLLAGQKDQMCMWPLYGDPGHKDPYMCHKWGYTQATLKALLKDAGLTQIELSPPQTHGARVNRDMRVEAIKP